MLMKRSLYSSVIFAVMFSLFLIQQCSAISAIDSQKSMTLTIEKGSSLEMPVVIQDVSEVTEIKATGDIADWVSFWGNHSTYDIFPGQTYILVSIDVPDDAKLGEYDGTIKAGSDTVSRIRIKVTIKLADAKAYQEMEAVDKQVNSLKDRVSDLTSDIKMLRTQVVTLQYNMTKKVEEIYKYQRDLSELEKDNSELKESLQEIKNQYAEVKKENEKLNSLTGSLVSTQIPGMFLVGIVIGVFAMLVTFRREHYKRHVKSKLSMISKRRKKEEQFRYSFSNR